MPRAAISVATRTLASPEANARQRALARVLRFVAMQGFGDDARLRHVCRHAVGTALGSRKDDGARKRRIAEKLLKKARLAFLFHEDHALRDAVGSCAVRGDLQALGPVENSCWPSFAISGGIVAENIADCRISGASPQSSGRR